MKSVRITSFIIVVTWAFAYADDAPARSSQAPHNAAVVYWQAFAAAPVFSSDEQKLIDGELRGTPQAPVSKDAIPLIDRYATSLKQLRRANRASTCDWELEWSAGPEIPLPHLAKGRELSRASLLRARLRRDQGDADGAVEEILVVLTMARRLASSPLLISFLVDSAIEKDAYGLLATCLPTASTAALERAAAEISTMPQTPSLSDCMDVERRIHVDWLKRQALAESARPDVKPGAFLKPFLDGNDDTNKKLRSQLDALTTEDLMAAIAKLEQDYADLVRISKLSPYGERKRAIDQFFEQFSKTDAGANLADRTRVLSMMLIPVMQKVVESEERRRIRRELMSLAVRVLRQGPEGLKNSSSPDKDQIEFVQINKGFELRYQLAPDLSPETFRVGATEK